VEQIGPFFQQQLMGGARMAAAHAELPSGKGDKVPELAVLDGIEQLIGALINRR
jgi:hypothetical protein